MTLEYTLNDRKIEDVLNPILPSLEGEIVEHLSKYDPLGHVDEIVSHPKFKDYQLVTTYPKILIYVEKEFVEKNPDLINDLISNSVYLRI